MELEVRLVGAGFIDEMEDRPGDHLEGHPGDHHRHQEVLEQRAQLLQSRPCAMTRLFS